MHTKHLLATTMIAAMVFTQAAVPVFAEDATPSPSPSNRWERAQERMQENRDKRNDRRGDRLQKHCDNVNTRLTTLLGKIDTRITKQKEAGKDTSAAETAAADARTALASGMSLCAQAVEKFDSVPTDKWSVQEPIVKEGFALAKQAREQFVKARKAIADALRALAKNAGVKTGQTQ